MSDLALFETDLAVPLIGSTFGHDTPRVRKDAPATSHAAAETNDVHGSRAVVLAAFHERKFFADHQLVAFLASSGYTPQRIRSARAELAEAGLIELVGHYEGAKFVPDTTTTENGRQARIWTLRKDAA